MVSKVQKYALNSQLALQILTNDDEVENWSCKLAQSKWWLLEIKFVLDAVQTKSHQSNCPFKSVSQCGIWYFS